MRASELLDKLRKEQQVKRGFEHTHTNYLSSHSSKTTKKRSKRDMIAGDIATFALSVFDRSYLPPTGLAAARIDVRALSVACMPLGEGRFEMF